MKLDANKVFWVSAAAAALWLGYRALKKSSVTKTTIVDTGSVSPSTVGTAVVDQGWGWGAYAGYNQDDNASWAAALNQDMINWVNQVPWVDFKGNNSSTMLYDAYLEAKRWADASSLSDPMENEYFASVVTQIRGRMFLYQYPETTS